MATRTEQIALLIKQGTVTRNNWGYKSPFSAGATTDQNPSRWLVPNDSRYNGGSPEMASAYNDRKWVYTWKTAILLRIDQGHQVAAIYQNYNGSITLYQQEVFTNYSTVNGVKSLNGNYEWIQTPIEMTDIATDINISCSLPIFSDYNDMVNYLNSSTVDPSAFNGTMLINEDSDDEGTITLSDDIIGVNTYTGIADLDEFTTLATIDTANLKVIAEYIAAGWMVTTFGSTLVQNAIISTKRIITPGPISTGATTDIISANKIATLLGKTVKGNKITSQVQIYDMGSFRIPNYFYSFLDYEPYTKIQLYLPFCGIQNISSKDVVGTLCNLQVAVDMVTGDIVYYLKVTGNNERVLYQWNGNSSYDIAITGEDFGRKISSYVSSTSAMVGLGIGVNSISKASAPGASVITSNPSSGSTLSFIESARQNDMISCGNVTSNNGLGGIKYPYLIVRRPNPIEPNNYSETIGKPSMEYNLFSSLSGYTEVFETHLENIDATSVELDEIDKLLRTGVIF